MCCEAICHVPIGARRIVREGCHQLATHLCGGQGQNAHADGLAIPGRRFGRLAIRGTRGPTWRISRAPSVSTTPQVWLDARRGNVDSCTELTWQSPKAVWQVEKDARRLMVIMQDVEVFEGDL